MPLYWIPRVRKGDGVRPMPRMLNYKSYYEVFKLGVVDGGFTPVARMLFFPLFDLKGDIIVCDENDIPFEVTNKNASAWGHGVEPIPLNIQRAIGKNEALDALIKHFGSEGFRAEISDAKEDEMYEAMVSLVEECENVPDSKKMVLLKYYMNQICGVLRLFPRQIFIGGKSPGLTTALSVTGSCQKKKRSLASMPLLQRPIKSNSESEIFNMPPKL